MLRWPVFILTALTLGLWITSAQAAPGCENRQGDLVRCDVASAMPLGWKVPADVFTARVLSRTPPAQTHELVSVAVVLICLFAIIALLPRFDGTRQEDWDRQEGDE
jgi:hypothetical protein